MQGSTDTIKKFACWSNERSSLSLPEKTIRDIDVSHKRIFLRADFNVPLSEDGKIDSDFRIVKSLPTIEYLLKRKAEIVVTAHLGRPDGKKMQSSV